MGDIVKVAKVAAEITIDEKLQEGLLGYHLHAPDLSLRFWPQFFSEEESGRLMQALTHEDSLIPWRQESIRIMGRMVQEPRLTAWHGDPGAAYAYSGRRLEPQAWNEPLLEIKNRIEAAGRHPFNSVLLNWYRDGRDSMGWHADDERSLGRNPVIGSVSFGAARRFLLRRKSDHAAKIELMLGNGSLLLMEGPTQHHWHHAVPKQARINEQRVNLTFRRIMG